MSVVFIGLEEHTVAGSDRLDDLAKAYALWMSVALLLVRMGAV